MMKRTEPPDMRRRELAMVHIAVKQLGLDDVTYRQMLWSVARVRSSADLDSAGRKSVLDHLRARGFKPQAKSAGKPRPRPPADRVPMVRKINAMLRAQGREAAYADGMAKRMFGVDRYEWLNGDQMRRLVAALVYDAKRREAKTS